MTPRPTPQTPRQASPPVRRRVPPPGGPPLPLAPDPGRGGGKSRPAAPDPRSPGQPGGPSSPQGLERKAAGMPGRTGAASTRAVPVRDRAPQTPESAPDASALSAGSTSVLAAAMTEAQLEEHVRALCADLGILRFHVRDSRGMNRGLPDDILIGPRGILWRELKTQTGRLTPEQRATGQALSLLGQDFAVWRPAHLLSGAVAQELVELSGRPLAMDGRMRGGAA